MSGDGNGRPAGRGRFLLLEGLVIVASILAAFGLEAWWDERRERAQEQVILQGLRTDFLAARAELADVLGLHEQIAHSVRTTLTALEEAAETGRTSVTIPDTAVFMAYIPPTTQLSLGTRDGLLQAGQLGILSDPELRSALSSWDHVLGEMTEEEIGGLNFVRDHLDPVLWSRVNVSAFRYAPDPSRAETPETLLSGTTELPVDNEILGVFAARWQILYHLLEEFPPVMDELDHIVALIDESLETRGSR